MRKGISEIISSVLLLAIAVSIAGIYSQWAPDFSRNTSQEIANDAENQLKCSNAAFSVSEVEYDSLEQILTFELSNKGTITFNNDILITAVNSSEIAGQKTIGTLQVGETQSVELETNRKPDTLITSSQECPDLRVTETV
jgi:flagellin-like protein